MGTYRLSEQADADLVRIHQWGVRHHGEAQADAWFFGLIDQFQAIADYPLSYPRVDELREGYRRCVFNKRDSIYFRIVGATVEIMTIIGKQDLAEWL